MNVIDNRGNPSFGNVIFWRSIAFRILNMNEYTKEVKIFKALSHPTRIAILELLRNGEQCVCHFEAALGLRQAYVSQQLMSLHKAGILAKRREGWNIYYHVINAEIYTLLDSAYQLTGTPHSVSEIDPAVCTCPHCKHDLQDTVVITELEL